VGKTTNTILTARRDYLIKQLELKFEKAGVTEALKTNYLECHTKFGPYVEKKCGSTGVCEESTELLGLDGKPLSEASESEKSSSTALSGADAMRSSSDGRPLENLVEDYPRDKVLILVREDPITTQTCDLFKRVSGWHDQAICVNNQDDWKVLCMAAESVLKDLLEMPAKVAGTVGSSENSEQSLLHIARNGGASFITTRWRLNQWREWGECGVQVNYSGMYEGSTINESLWAPVQGIVIEGDGTVVLTH
jgi:hypothetical protein